MPPPGDITRTWLENCLPHDAGARLSRRSTLLVTRLPLLATEHITEFGSKQDVVEVVMASAHLPLVLDGTLYTFCRQRPAVDGGFWWWWSRCEQAYWVPGGAAPPPADAAAAAAFASAAAAAAARSGSSPPPRLSAASAMLGRQAASLSAAGLLGVPEAGLGGSCGGGGAVPSGMPSGLHAAAAA